MMQKRMNCPAGIALLLCVLVLNGCATPIGVHKVSPQEAYRSAYANPLNEGVASDQAKYVLNRYYLLEKFKDDPAAAIADLHEKALRDDRRDILYALAEASYLYGDQLANKSLPENRALAPDYFLLSALYAYYFFLEVRSEPVPTAFDRRARNAVDLYNFGLWHAFATGEGGALELEGKTRKLPFGRLSISLDTSKLYWAMEDFEKFEPANQYEIRGVAVRNRTPGVGLPLIGIKKKSLDSFSAVPVTAFLRIHGNLASLSAGNAVAHLELHSTVDSGTLLFDNRVLPLETDYSAPLAYKLEDSEMWDFGASVFLGRVKNRIPDGLYLHEPYRPGKIPVVFVHGTASSPIWWTEMFNTLRFDPLIREKFQFWYFLYTSSQPVVVSAADLRDALHEKLEQLDPEKKDTALQQMVVIGHSQGGLLTKLTAVEMGDSLVRAMTEEGIDSMKTPEEVKTQLRRVLMIRPLPFVREVIFLSTPHRGSFLSKGWIRDLVRAIVRLPITLVESTLVYYDYMNPEMRKLLGGKRSAFTSVDGMSPDNPLLKALAEIPLAPGVRGHSIIAVKGDGDPKLGNDGVVEYESAHLDGMASELVVRGDHSSQLNPIAIDEVRRILVEHGRAYAPDGVSQK